MVSDYVEGGGEEEKEQALYFMFFYAAATRKDECSMEMSLIFLVWLYYRM
jgi:hypothetical protein